MRRLIVCLGASLLAGSAAAQNPFSGDVTYSDVDRATVRVFAVREVGVENVMGRRVLRTLAIPTAGHGSGVIVDPRGVIVTAAHVVTGAHHIAVRLSTGELHLARVVRMDETLDYAIIVLSTGSELPHLPLPDEPPVTAVRSTVDAIGYPLDADRDQPQSSRGIISAAMDDGRLQLSISLNPGISGGPLIDENETLLGIVVARGNVEAGVQGIGVAVPIRHIMNAHHAALTDGSMASAYDALQAIPDRSDRAAVVDALVRLGGVDVLRETVDAIDAGLQPERLALFHRLAQSTTDADLLSMLAAYFWDAALIALERSGGYASPAQMPAGTTRDLAHSNWNRAITFASKASQSDPQIVNRSPFIAYLATQFPDVHREATPQPLVEVAPIEDSPEVRRRRARAGTLRVMLGPVLGVGGSVKLTLDGDDLGSWDLEPSIGGSISAQLSLGTLFYAGLTVAGVRLVIDDMPRRQLLALDLTAGVRRGFDAGSFAVEPFGAIVLGVALAGIDGDYAPGLDAGVDAGATFWPSATAGVFVSVGWRMQLAFYDQSDATNFYHQVRLQLGLSVRVGD